MANAFAAGLMPMQNRNEALAERAALIQRLRTNLPDAMRVLPQWLLFKLEQREGEKKPRKVPYYVSGKRRTGTQGDAADRAALVSFDAALQRLGGAMHFAGLGFAFLPGDGLVGIDLDAAIDADGVVSERCSQIVARCASYTERSISGRGVHVIVAGETQTFKSNAIGVEVFCGSQYFTCTGAHWAGAPGHVVPIGEPVLQELRAMVEAAKEGARTVPPPSSAPAPGARMARAAQGDDSGDDFKRVKDAALQALDAWVPALFPKARRYRQGWRVTSKELGRELQEDLQITPDGAMDFGEERGLSPIDLVMQWRSLSAKEALLWLAGQLGIVLSGKPRLRVVPGPSAPPDERGDARPEPPPPSPGGEGTPAGGAAGKGGAGKGAKVIDWDKFRQLREDFALIYSTDTVFDLPSRLQMKIANMAHAHGNDMVKLWKAGKEAQRRSDEGRWTIKPACLVFDPSGSADPETHINLWNGFALEPAAGDVGPILELITFLTSRAADNPDECDAVKHYLLCWLAYPLQHPGAKLRTAVVMHGDEGAGKNFLTDLIVEIYGEYGATVGQDELEDKFNDWRSRKCFVCGDEVSSRAELVHNKNRLKALITSTTVQINPKNLPRREEANHINVWFNSNEIQPLALDNSDRRYLVIYTPKAKDDGFYKHLGEWKRNGGAAAFFHYLLNYEITDFDPFRPAPATQAKRDLIDMNRKSPERFWIEWSDGQIDLPYRSCTLVQAYQAYLKYAQRTGDRFPMQRNVFTRMLMRIADTAGRPCTDKVMKVDYAASNSPLVDLRATRMLLVTDPPEQEQGAWATECWRTFEPELRRYCGMGSRFGDDEGGSDG